MRRHPGVAAKALTTLDELGIKPEIVTTSPIKIACFIPREQVEEAVRALHARLRARQPRGSEEHMTDPRIGVVGATGAVGQVTLALLAERGFGQVRALPHRSRSAGSTVAYGYGEPRGRGSDGRGARSRRARPLLLLRRDRPSSELVPAAVQGGAVCVDKSSAFRLTDGVPLSFRR